eukprot:9498047-Pyramimonas_sp.AAC.5
MTTAYKLPSTVCEATYLGTCLGHKAYKTRVPTDRSSEEEGRRWQGHRHPPEQGEKKSGFDVS